MVSVNGGVSFYFFDIDDNLLFLPTQIYLYNAETKTERAVSSGSFAAVQNFLGRSGEWSVWSVRDESFRDFRDRPGISVEEQPFFSDVAAALVGKAWRGPSWPLFVHAAQKQRPIACVSARGHAPATVTAGLNLLAAHEGLPAPNVLGIYTVTNADVRTQIGATDPAMTTPSVKKLAIKDAVSIFGVKTATGQRLPNAAPSVHAIKMNPRRPNHLDLFDRSDDTRHMLRRPYFFDDGFDTQGNEVRGVHHMSFARDVVAQYEWPVMMWQTNPDFPVKGANTDRLFNPTGGAATVAAGYYFIPPAAAGSYLGAALAD